MTDRNPTVVVTSDETLPGIIERLSGAGLDGRTVHLVIPVDSPLLLTASEFRALKDAIDEHRLAVQMRSSDPLRLRLAERLGMHVQALPRPRVAVATMAAPARAPHELSPPAAGRVPLQDAPPAPAVTPRTDPDSHWPALNGDAAAENAIAPDRPAAAFANPPRRWLPVAAALLVLVLGAFFAIRYLLPQAVIRIVPRTAPVAASLLFDVTGDGQPLDDGAVFALKPQDRQLDVVWTGTAPASGVRLEPDGTAGGPIELRNPSSEPLVVDAGTVVVTETDVEFTFTEPVTVPAADPATGDPGAATGKVAAVRAGSVGNVGNGELGGRLPNGVYYSNRMEPTAGGSDQEFPVVAKEDLDALHAAAVEAAPALAADAIADERVSLDVIASSVTVAAQRDDFDHQVGAEAESVSLTASLTLQVMAYDGAAAAAQLEPIFESRLNGEAPDGFAVSPAEIAFEEPKTIEENERGMRLEVAAQAEAEAVLDDAERQALVAALAGAGPEESAAILARWPQIAEFTIDYHPSWLPHQMPVNTERIRLELAP